LVKVRREETAALVGGVEAAVPEVVPVAVPIEELATETGVEVVTGKELAVCDPVLMLVPVAVTAVEAEPELEVNAPIANTLVEE